MKPASKEEPTGGGRAKEKITRHKQHPPRRSQMMMGQRGNEGGKPTAPSTETARPPDRPRAKKIAPSIYTRSGAILNRIVITPRGRIAASRKSATGLVSYQRRSGWHGRGVGFHPQRVRLLSGNREFRSHSQARNRQSSKRQDRNTEYLIA